MPLILVLGHDECGAVRAAIDSQAPDADTLPPHIASMISKIVPAVRRVGGAAFDASAIDALDVGRAHLRDTIAELLQESELISDAVAAGTLGIVGANYRLLEGRVVADTILGLDPSPIQKEAATT